MKAAVLECVEFAADGFVNFHNSHPYSSVARTLLLKRWRLVFKMVLLLFQMFLEEANACPALESLALISNSDSPSVATLEPRNVSQLTSSTTFPCGMIGASERWFILMCLVFFVLILNTSMAAVDAWCLCGGGIGGGWRLQSQGHSALGRESIRYLFDLLLRSS